jgi:hypothetical protein
MVDVDFKFFDLIMEGRGGGLYFVLELEDMMLKGTILCL